MNFSWENGKMNSGKMNFFRSLKISAEASKAKNNTISTKHSCILPQDSSILLPSAHNSLPDYLRGWEGFKFEEIWKEGRVLCISSSCLQEVRIQKGET